MRRKLDAGYDANAVVSRSRRRHFLRSRGFQPPGSTAATCPVLQTRKHLRPVTNSAQSINTLPGK